MKNSGPAEPLLDFQAASATATATTAATTGTPATHAAAGTHAASWPHATAAAFRRRIVRQCDAAFTCALRHALMVFGADAFPLLFGLCRSHAIAIFVSFLLGHQLTAVDAVLRLVPGLIFSRSLCIRY